MGQLLSLRVNDTYYDQLKPIADEQGKSVAMLVRDIIHSWFEQRDKAHLTALETAQLKALSETLYLTRALADRVEPTLRDAASAHAARMIESLREEKR